MCCNPKSILFNTKMVKAVLDGIKTQTRRVVGDKILNRIYKYDCYIEDGKIFESCMCQGMPDGSGGLEVDRWEEDVTTTYSKYKVGDVLWVREPVKVTKACNDTLKMEFEYLSDGTKKIIDIPKKYLDEYDFIKNNCFLAKLNQLHYDKKYVGVPNGCLKEMARIFLKVTNVRVERLKDIKYSDMEKEGVSYKDFLVKEGVSINEQFQRNWVNLWNSTSNNGYKWEDNPFVFVYEFEKVEVC
ncbi:hypothetical protein [Aliarcobacter butzleri]|uniref:hypothetical protein n=1 Tax=Aliarcobacter butzleri TaxID=28197 RepID=UPI00126A5EE7|nr:hypothetical protein [Aliarcobacter butzleri]